MLPGGVAVTGNTVYVTTPVFGDGMIAKVRVPAGGHSGR